MERTPETGSSLTAADVDALVRLAMSEPDVVKGLVGHVQQLQEVQRAKAALAGLQDPTELRRVLTSRDEEEE